MALVRHPIGCTIEATVESAVGMPIIATRGMQVRQPLNDPRQAAQEPGAAPPKAARGWRLTKLERIEELGCIRLPLVWTDADINEAWDPSDETGQPAANDDIHQCRPTTTQPKRRNEYVFGQVAADSIAHVATNADWPPQTPLRVEFSRGAPPAGQTKPQALRIIWSGDINGDKLQLVYPRGQDAAGLSRSRVLTLLHGPYPGAGPLQWDTDTILDELECGYTRAPEPWGREWIEVEWIGGYGQDQTGQHLPLQMIVRINDAPKAWIYDLEAHGGLGYVPGGKIVIALAGGSYSLAAKRGHYEGGTAEIESIEYTCGTALGDAVPIPADVTSDATIRVRYWVPYRWPLASPPAPVGHVFDSYEYDVSTSTGAASVILARETTEDQQYTPFLWEAMQDHGTTFTAVEAPSGGGGPGVVDGVFLSEDIVSAEITYPGWPMKGITGKLTVRNWRRQSDGSIVSNNYDRLYGARRVTVVFAHDWGGGLEARATMLVGWITSRPITLDSAGAEDEQMIEFQIGSRTVLYSGNKPMFGQGSFADANFVEAVTGLLANAGIPPADLWFHDDVAGLVIPRSSPQGGGLEFAQSEDCFKALDTLCEYCGVVWGESHLGGFLFYPLGWLDPRILLLRPDNVDVNSFAINPSSEIGYAEAKTCACAKGYDPAKAQGNEAVFIDREALFDAASPHFVGHDLWEVVEATETAAPEVPALMRLLKGKRAKMGASWRMSGSDVVPGQLVNMQTPQSGIPFGKVLQITGKTSKATSKHDGDGMWWDEFTVEWVPE